MQIKFGFNQAKPGWETRVFSVRGSKPKAEFNKQIN